MASKRRHIRVSGRVQGVFFRANAASVASRLGLGGWVRNLSDGSVEIMVEGEEGGVAKFTEWCRRGPPLAHVTGVDIEDMEFKGEFDSFRILY